MFESPRYIRELTGVGVSAYLLKTTSSDHLVAAVRAAVLDPGRRTPSLGYQGRCWRAPRRAQPASSPPGS